MNVNVLLSKVKLFKEVDGDKLHQLTFGIYKDNLRMYIKESPKDDVRNNILVFNVALMPINARLLANELENLNDQKEGYNIGFQMFGAKWENNKRVDGKEIVGTIGVARAKNKDDDVVNVIYVVSPLNVKFVFPLEPTPYLTVLVNGKVVEDKELLSKKITSAYAKTFSALLDTFPEAQGNAAVVQQHKQPAPEPVIVKSDDLLDDL